MDKTMKYQERNFKSEVLVHMMALELHNAGLKAEEVLLTVKLIDWDK
jgi:hypothetical protein